MAVEISGMKKKHLEILLEDMRDDIKLVLEGQQVLRNEIIRTREELREEIKLNTVRLEVLIDRVDSVEKNLSNRLDAVAADFKTHRADTEIHHGVYRVRELQKDYNGLPLAKSWLNSANLVHSPPPRFCFSSCSFVCFVVKSFFALHPEFVIIQDLTTLFCFRAFSLFFTMKP